MKILGLFKKHYIITIIVLCISIGIIFHFSGIIFYGLIKGLITSIIILIISKIIGCFNTLGFRRQNFFNGLLFGFPALIPGLYVLILSFTNIPSTGFSKPNYFFAAIFFLFLISSAIFEELLMRGIILNILIRNCKSKLRAIIISSTIFGFSHLYGNIANGRIEITLADISQLLYTPVMGIFFSIIYLKYGNIWVIILIHLLFNVMSMGPFALFSSMNDFISLHSLKYVATMDLMVALIFLIYSLHLYIKHMDEIESVA